MKRILMVASVCLAALVSINTYASVCDKDMSEMRDQIREYGSITTSDNRFRFNAVDGAAMHGDRCQADGSYVGRRVCTIGWVPRDWGNTFYCVG